MLGMTCDGMDIIAKNITMPTNTKVGDWLCFGGMGAYTYGCRSNFNGMASTEKIITFPMMIHENEIVKEEEKEVRVSLF